MSDREKPEFYEIVLNVLGYKEENEWVALALDMDLRGYGNTWEEAVSDLGDLVFTQITFAHFKKQPEMIYKPADPVWFQLFANGRKAKLESDSAETEYITGGLSIPPPHVIAQMQGSFEPSNA
jgi:hypothetical protein